MGPRRSQKSELDLSKHNGLKTNNNKKQTKPLSLWGVQSRVCAGRKPAYSCDQGRANTKLSFVSFVFLGADFQIEEPFLFDMPSRLFLIMKDELRVVWKEGGRFAW